ncbi:ferric-chelate reductase 1 isoform X2 [Biomphalaria pfeifferi]|uniref:Ferric-chelate reductase 1 isoform X2 n=1 Tax=Biomphalaria pfeifferi TaxID=112525 RepID=A0AAD8FGY7_BIOPF|nr:ferric-chelate reductase 1 isoform X2 [Biomphalaria pfeifferi]
MMSSLIVLLLAVSLLVDRAECHRNGQGIDGSCADLTPQHSASAQNSVPPYTITFSPTSYTASQSISVTLSASSSKPFKGFMIQARNASSCSTSAQGSFTIVAGTTTACSNAALVHSSSSFNTLTTNWIAPSTSVGHIVFRASFVQEYTTFWTNVVSVVLQDSTLPALSAAAQCSATTPTQEGSFAKDTECGKTKGCFSSCGSSGCTFSVIWQTSSTSVTYTLKAVYQSSSGFYIALGFSGDTQMGNDSVIGCAYQSSSAVLYTAENVGKTPNPFSDSQISRSSWNYTNGVLTCSITRPISGSGKRYDLNQDWTLLFVLGAASISAGSGVASIQYHNQDFFISQSSVTASSIVDIAPLGKDDALVKAHGCLMVVAWVFFASIGLVVARYYKPVLSGTMCSQKIWFQVHRFSMVLVLCVTAIAFIIIFVKEDGKWSDLEGDETYLQGHPIMGVMVMILTILNPVMALFRPHPDTPRRPIFNWAHFLVGIAAHILGVITIFLGIQIKGATTPYYATYIMGAYIAWQLFVKQLLEIIRVKFNTKENRDSYEMNNKDNSSPNQSDSNGKKKALLKKIIFVIHCVVIAGLSAAIVAVIGVGTGGGD